MKPQDETLSWQLKNHSVLRSYQYLRRLEGRNGIFFVLINQMITVCKESNVYD